MAAMREERHMDNEIDETLDTIRDISLYQSRDGYRFSIDAVLLEDFISVRGPELGLELGAGSGIISILLARRAPDVRLVGVEIQEGLAGRALRNVLLNGLEDNIEICKGDMVSLQEMYDSNHFDFAYSNPPFRKTETGRISSSEERAIARHELEITLPELVRTAACMLKHSGRFSIIYHPFRLAELVELLRMERLEPKRMRFVHAREGEEAKMVMIEALKGSGTWLKVEPPLYIFNQDNVYTGEVQSILEPKNGS